MEEEIIEFQELKDVIDRQKLPAKCPPINWGPDFDDMPDQEKVVFLKKFANSFNYALDKMQNERNDWMEKCLHYEKQVLQMKNIVNHQRQMIQDTTQKENEVKAAYQDRINLLERKIKEIK